MRFLLNAMAVPASVAILFSLVSAVLFVRPLQRVGAMAQNLASGDLGVKVLQPTNDEVGDVARVLNQMATELRRRLLSAGMGKRCSLSSSRPYPARVSSSRKKVSWWPAMAPDAERCT
jgi:HAMP domain-containing protein